MLKTQRPVWQFAKAEIEVFVDRPGIDKQIPCGTLSEFFEVDSELDANVAMIEDAREHRRESVCGHFLEQSLK